jgi:hypothetical protein
MRKKTILLGSLFSILVVVSASADPLPGRDILKFSQLPMNGVSIVTGTDGTTTDYFGHDELSTAYTEYDSSGSAAPEPTGKYVGQFMADDFADEFNTPVVHVRWWGSYLNNVALASVDKFLISFERDIPDPDGSHQGTEFSRPGIPLLNQIVKEGPLSPGSGTFTEKPIGPGGDPLFEELYEYNAELHLGKEFFQDNDTVYWLKIVALVDVGPDIIPLEDPEVPKWGWHNRDYTVPNPLASPLVTPGDHLDNPIVDPAFPAPVWHFQDNSVEGFVSVDPINADDPLMPIVNQDVSGPRHYIDDVDGPGPGFTVDGEHGGIGQFSKDLAFELYTIPEPGSAMLLLLGLAGIGCLSRSRA